ncbi:MAG: alpha/beta hydrolase [Bdellovibrionota bacterium]
MPTQLKSSVTTSDKILVRWWKNAWNLKAPTRGLIFLCHGIGEHSGRYDETASYFTQWGFDVVSFDLPGHGLTARKGNYNRFASFDEMLAEAKGVLKYWLTEGPDASPELRAKPLYLMGHSMGALLSLYWLATLDQNPEEPFSPKKALVCAPPLALSMKVPKWKELLAEVLRTTVPDIKLGNEISADYLSHDKVVTYDYVKDPWRVSKASPRLYLSMKSAMSVVRDSPLKIQIPLMIVNGSEDPIIDHQELKSYYGKLNTHKKWIEYKGLYHELFNEIGREKVYEEVIKWFL